MSGVITGRITGISGPTVTVVMDGLKLYDRVYVGRGMLTGEVVRLARGGGVVQVYEDPRGLAVGEHVMNTGAPLSVRLGPGLLGSMLDGLQRPLERIREKTGAFIMGSADMYALEPASFWPFHPLKNKGDMVEPGDAVGYVIEREFKHYVFAPPGISGRIESIESEGTTTLDSPMATLEGGQDINLCHEWPVRIPRPGRGKLPPKELLLTGQRIIDFLIPLARGGTAMMPGGFGTGKTILQQSIAKFSEVDVVVYAGCGERGNEMADLIEELTHIEDPRTGRGLMERTILVVNTSNMPVAAREASIYTAITMAEYYRDMGLNVLMLADSLSRWAEALREISSTLAEMPGEEGYPTYLTSRLAGFFERAGVVRTPSGATGSLSLITAVSPPGADFTEPVTQSCLRAAGAFIMLDTAMAHRRQFPAINHLQSYSLYDGVLKGDLRARAGEEWQDLVARAKQMLKDEERLMEIAEVVGTEGLQDEDRLLMAAADALRRSLLMQNAFDKDDAFSTLETTLKKARAVIYGYEKAREVLGSGAAQLAEILKKGFERTEG